jgi:hypothetical protein
LKEATTTIPIVFAGGDDPIAAGGMATVFLAHDEKHDREVAIKVLDADLGAALGGERFLAEIKTTAKLQHPHILPLLDSGEADALLYYVMPFVPGETLRARLERERQDSVVRAADADGREFGPRDRLRQQLWRFDDRGDAAHVLQPLPGRGPALRRRGDARQLCLQVLLP